MKNKRWLVPEILSFGSVPQGEYDFIYAFSIFTHLNRQAFFQGVGHLFAALRPGGKLYFTVRHLEFLDACKKEKKVPVEAQLDESGFWHQPYPNRAVFGETVVSREYVQSTFGDLGCARYLGSSEVYQHIYAIDRRG